MLKGTLAGIARSGLLAALLAGCAVGSVEQPPDVRGPGGPDAADALVPTDGTVPDAPPSDASRPPDAPVLMDAPRSDTATPRDVATDAVIGTDTVTPRDVVSAVDVPVARDAAVACGITCAGDGDCQRMCPTAMSGYVNCCMPGAGGGTCYQNLTMCPGGMTGTDAGGTDSAVSGGGMPGDLCTTDSQCGSGGANCCSPLVGGVGVCACRIPLLGCSPFGC